VAEFFENIKNFFNDILQNILDFLWDILVIIIHMLFDWINIPPFPEDLRSGINEFLDLIFENVGLLGFFIRPETLTIVLPLVVFLFSFKYIYKLILWIARKIPFINIS